MSTAESAGGGAAHAVAASAARLIEADRTRTPCAPLTDLIGSTDIRLAYEVQQAVIAHRLASGAVIVGRKIGLTSEAVQKQIGVDRPDFGVLLADTQYASGDTIPFDRLLQPRAEAEIAFILAADIDEGFDDASLRASVDYAVAALEIVDSRVLDWKIAITDTIADNASSGVFVLSERRLRLSEFEPRDVAMTASQNGTVVSWGIGAACLGDPFQALAWLARTALENGDPLKAGDIVLSGALGPVVPVRPEDVFTAELGPLGTVTAHFSSSERI